MEILSTFGINIKMLIASIINFIILLYLLNKIVYQPLLKVLDDRKKKIDESLTNAETIEKKLQETKTHEKEILHQARIEAEKIIKTAEALAQTRHQQILNSATEQSTKILERAEAKIAQNRLDLEKELKESTVSLVIETTKLILGDKMPSSVNNEYVSRAIKVKTDKYNV